MLKYSCMIVDDEPLSHQVLKNYIAQLKILQPPVSFFNAEDAQSYLVHEIIDILFLDIQMPEITGLQFLKKLTVKPVTIFTTAFRKYALDGFDLGIADYLLKPISFDRFDLAVKRAVELVEAKRTETNFEIEIKEGTQSILLDFRDIEFAKGLKDYTILYTKNKNFVVLGTLKIYEERLPATYFLRVHKSYLVAKNKIKNIKQQKIMCGNAEIPIGRSYKKNVLSLFANTNSQLQ